MREREREREGSRFGEFVMRCGGGRGGGFKWVVGSTGTVRFDGWWGWGLGRVVGKDGKMCACAVEEWVGAQFIGPHNLDMLN